MDTWQIIVLVLAWAWVLMLLVMRAIGQANAQDPWAQDDPQDRQD